MILMLRQSFLVTPRLSLRPFSSTRAWDSIRPLTQIPPTTPATEAQPAEQPEGLAGTVPHHTAYVVLHHPAPPAAYPPRLDSPLYRSLLLSAKAWGGIVNFGHFGEDGLSLGSPANERVDKEGDLESYPATVYFEQSLEGSHPPLYIPRLNEGSLKELALIAQEFIAQKPSFRPNLGISIGATFLHPNEAHLLVCTHGARDCRCGTAGGALVGTLRSELGARRARADVRGGVWERIRVGEVAHVGGHKHAANVLVFPSGDWLGKLTAADAPRVLDAVAAQLSAESRSTGLERTLGSHWRGRMGLTKGEQLRTVISS